MNTNNIFNSAPAPSPAPHKYTDADLVNILKPNERLSGLEAFAKKKLVIAIEEAIKDDEMQEEETRFAENFARPALLTSIAALRAAGVMRNNQH